MIKINANRINQVKQTAEQLIDSGQFCGIAWQFAQHSDVLSEGEVGWLDEPGGKPLPDDALYRIYSMTKPIVSVVALQLMEQGVLRLGDPVALYLPEFSQAKILRADGSEQLAKVPMNIEHLLTHRAGLSYDFLPRCDVARRYQTAQLIERGSRTLDEFVSTVAGLPLAFEPGTQWRYSVATDVLARVLEVASGKSLPALLDEYLFKPCDMHDTAFFVAEEKQVRLASMFGSRQLGQVPTPGSLPQGLPPLDASDSHPVNAPNTFVRGGHGLYSTTLDYQRFLSVLMNGKSPSGQQLLSPLTVDMMWQDRIPEAQQPLAIGDNPMPGYGWNLTGRVMSRPGEVMSLTLPGEGGWGGAAATYFFVHPETGLNGVVMTQYLGSMVPVGDDLRVAFLQAVEL